MLLLKAKKEWEALSFTVNGKDFEQLKMGIDEGLVHGITGYKIQSDGTMLMYGDGKVAEFKAVNPECAFLTARVVVLDADNVRHHVDNILTAGYGEPEEPGFDFGDFGGLDGFREYYVSHYYRTLHGATVGDTIDTNMERKLHFLAEDLEKIFNIEGGRA